MNETSASPAQRQNPADPVRVSAMSIDVEAWFQVENLRGAVPRDSWDQQELRVERNVDRILELMDQHNVRATFFILGWVAERCPELMARIAAGDHEIASHGYGHDLVYSLSQEQFREDLRRAKDQIESTTGALVRGYRAPSFSITEWAIDILLEEGYEYDSSGFATVGHDRYGTLKGLDPSSTISEIRDGFYEVSVSSLRVGSHALPWGGGGYFRLIPYGVFKRGVLKILESMPYSFYLHPWEIDPGQPRVKVKPSFAFRHYNNLSRCEARLDSLLADFQWAAVGDMLDQYKTRGD